MTPEEIKTIALSSAIAAAGSAVATFIVGMVIERIARADEAEAAAEKTMRLTYDPPSVLVAYPVGTPAGTDPQLYALIPASVPTAQPSGPAPSVAGFSYAARRR